MNEDLLILVEALKRSNFSQIEAYAINSAIGKLDSKIKEYEDIISKHGNNKGQDKK